MHHLSKIATHLSAQSSIDSRLIYHLLTPSQLKVKEGLLFTIEFDKYCKGAYMFQQSWEPSHITFPCLKSIIETLEKGVKYIKSSQ